LGSFCVAVSLQRCLCDDKKFPCPKMLARRRYWLSPCTDYRVDTPNISHLLQHSEGLVPLYVGTSCRRTLYEIDTLSAGTLAYKTSCRTVESLDGGWASSQLPHLLRRLSSSRSNVELPKFRPAMRRSSLSRPPDFRNRRVALRDSKLPSGSFAR